MDEIVIVSKQGNRNEPLIALLEAIFPECEIRIPLYVENKLDHSKTVSEESQKRNHV